MRHWIRSAALVAGVLWFSAPAAVAQFATLPAFPVPGSPTKTAAAAGNFNGDAFTDLAIAYEGGIAVFLGTGPGSYGPALLHPGLPSNWDQVVASDLDSDGLTDLVVANNSVFVLLADGSGGFVDQSPGPLPGPVAEGRGVGLGDTNEDGHPDLVVPVFNYPTLHLAISLGDGAGGFGAWTAYAVSATGSGQVAVGDVNGDGAADALIAHQDAGVLLIALNNGSGGFGTGTAIVTGQDPRGLALADFDGDGELDVAVANGGSASLTILKGNGVGGFAVTHYYPGPVDSTGVVATDVDGDGRVDLVVGGIAVWTYRGDGAGGFADPGRYLAVGLPWVVDVDADGRPDVLAGSSQVFNLGGGAFAAPRQFGAGFAPHGLALADMNGDGRVDIVTANGLSNSVTTLYGLGTGAFSTPVPNAVGSDPRSVAVADFNGDGRKDAAVANRASGNVSVLLGIPGGGLGPAANFPAGTEPRSLAAGDINGDGKPDLAVSATGALSVFFGTGTGTFVPGPTYPYPFGNTSAAVALASLNPDTRIDAALAVGGAQGGLHSMLGTGAGFLPPQLQGSIPCDTAQVVLGDVNGDGNLDVVTGPDQYCIGFLMFGDGHGSFVPGSIPSMQGGAAIADFTRDGKPDLLFGGSAGVASLQVGDGSGAFGLLGATFPVGGAGGPIGVADFDLDGQPDAAVAIRNGNAVTILLNRAAAPGADLSLAVQHAPDPAPPGGPLTLTATITNQGPLTAIAPTLDLQLPGSVNFVSSVPGAPTCVTSPAPPNVLLTCSLSDMPPASSANVVVNLTAGTAEGIVVPFDARLRPGAPLDPDPVDNQQVHLVQIGAAPDVAVSMSDSADPVSPGATFDYILDVANVGAGLATSVSVTGTLDSVTYQGSNPPGYCNGGVYLYCGFGDMPGGTSRQVAITVQAGTFTMISNSVTADVQYDANPANDSASEETRGELGIRRELAHGSALTESLAPGTPAERLYYLRQQPHASYEVVVDAVSGDVAGASQAVSMQRLDAGLSVVQDAQAAGAGGSRRLSFENASDQGVESEVLRVRSTGCSTGCGPGDGYRIRAIETTARIPRYNTIGTQITLLVIENRTASPVQGHAWLWEDVDGQLVGSIPFSLGGHQTTIANLAGVIPGRRGTVTISHDGPYGALAGKGVAVEPATGFTFDTAMEYRTR